MPIDQPHAEKALSILDHLEELRTRIIRSLIAVAICFVIGYIFAPQALQFLARPLIHAQAQVANAEARETLALEVAEDGTLRLRNPELLGDMSETPSRLAIHLPGSEEPAQVFYAKPVAPLLYLRPIDPFMIRLQAAFVLALLLSMPVLLYNLWGFVAPGLLPKERKLALPVILTGSLLFPAGAFFAYYLLEFALVFLAEFMIEHTVLMNDARAYLGFALTMMLAFGLTFELPLVIVIATRVGLVSVDWLAARRKYVFVILLIVSAIITPTGDPFTLMAMTGPLYILFELALIASRLMDKVSSGEEEAGTESSEPEAPAD